MAELAIPGDVEELTPEWLTAALASRGHLSGSPVVAVERTLLSAGRGFIGHVARLRLTYDREGAGPASLIAKMPVREPAILEATRPLRLFEREASFYEQVAPRTPIRLAKCWYSRCDPADDRAVLLLDDLAPAVEGDQLAGCTPQQAALIVRDLARLHGAWWQSPELNGFDWLFPVNDPRQKTLQARYQEALPVALGRWGGRLSPTMRDFAERYATRFEALLDAIAAMPQTVQHADLRLDNVLFGEDADGPWAAIIDWQAPTRGGGMQDLAFFLTQSLAVETRRASERDLIAIYLEELRAGGVVYPDAAALADYRVAMLWGWLLPTWAANNTNLAEPRAGALWDAVLDRAATAIEEWRAYEALPS